MLGLQCVYSPTVILEIFIDKFSSELIFVGGATWQYILAI